MTLTTTLLLVLAYWAASVTVGAAIGYGVAHAQVTRGWTERRGLLALAGAAAILGPLVFWAGVIWMSWLRGAP